MSTISTFGARPVRARCAASAASAAARWPACTSTGSRVGATTVVSAVIGSKVTAEVYQRGHLGSAAVIGDPRGRPGDRTTATGGKALLAAVLSRTAAGETTDDTAVAAELEEGLDDVRRDLEELILRGLLTGTVIRAFEEG